MRNICNYKGNGKVNAVKRNIKLLKLINNFSEDKEFKKILDIISSKLEVPTNYLLHYVKFITSKVFYKKMEFSKKFKLLYLPISITFFFHF